MRTGVSSSHGYLMIIRHGHPRANRDGYVREHILVAEKALGKHLPKQAEVHHVNTDRADNSGKNLVICQDHQYHRILHVRQRVMSYGGNPDTQLICCSCQALKTFDEFGKDSSSYNGLRADCRQCRVRK